MQLILFMGIQGAGKSSFYKRFFSDSHVRINLDMLKTKHREKVLFNACLQGKIAMVIDRTNPEPDVRAQFIQPALQHGFEVVGYYFDVQLEDALKRNNQRKGKAKIPVAGVKMTAQRMIRPSFDEGFHRLFYVDLVDGRFIITEQTSHQPHES